MSGTTFVDVNERQTRVHLGGEVSGPPILLLHGISRSLEDWQPQFTRYSKAGYRVIAPDLPGFGFSERLPASAALPGLAQGVLETLDAIGEVRPLHVMGNSLGGACALQLLTVVPDRVASLVLVSSAGFGAELHPFLRMIATPVIGSFAARNPNRAVAQLAERTLHVDRSVVTEEAIDRAMAIARIPGYGAMFHEMARSFASVRGVRPGWRDKLLVEVSRHTRPRVIVWGDRDRILPVKHLDAARRALPHAKVHLFEGVGHMPQLESPDRFGQVTLDFLRSHALKADE